MYVQVETEVGVQGLREPSPSHVFLPALRQCLQGTLVTLSPPLCKLRPEATTSPISLSTAGGSKGIGSWVMGSRTGHCESWNDRSRCNKRDLGAEIERTAET